MNRFDADYLDDVEHTVSLDALIELALFRDRVTSGNRVFGQRTVPKGEQAALKKAFEDGMAQAGAGMDLAVEENPEMLTAPPPEPSLMAQQFGALAPQEGMPPPTGGMMP